ncbi:hypothetical protein MTR67_001825, partial [Solanum verrucosum]
SSIASPLSRLTFSIVQSLLEEFSRVEDSTYFSPVLTLPGGLDGFVVYYDASRIGLGCVLMQHDLNLRKRRWLDLLKDNDMSILYHSSKANVVADALSWLSMNSV